MVRLERIEDTPRVFGPTPAWHQPALLIGHARIVR